ncbi:hypothetical protein BJ684DRAFT_19584 [Piptocephalis cylindrospora]|uniref:OTU domain-containing protein n=1 Tax=Piptocephalis cylindrospora TaxID=1907219 RepID=A0A4P9Y5H6_9FUNG|nr:hypothetical protein BJ684DRAFT_19584 [Piptocephalis cylindrospora]|eukprot:RKP13972.1 hypothetical protein BJ684DRAFT_19584 [Piptocephalis cylindrospora]
MSDTDAPSNLEVPSSITETEDLVAMQARHKREVKELTGRMTALKKTATKGDKKKKKEVLQECSQMETAIKNRHRQELAHLEIRDDHPKVEEEEEVATTILKEQDRELEASPIALATEEEPQRKGKKINRARQRLERRAEQVRQMQAEAEAEAEGQVDMRAVENEAIESLAKARACRVVDIVPDGHCLYNAIADQLDHVLGLKMSYQEIRGKVAMYMREHKDDFLPFITSETGDLLDDAGFEAYCDALANTAVWGGEPEILAISKVYATPVHIIQMGAPALVMGAEEKRPDGKKDPMIITYHKHMYGLGAHYNSLRPQ